MNIDFVIGRDEGQRSCDDDLSFGWHFGNGWMKGFMGDFGNDNSGSSVCLCGVCL